MTSARTVALVATSALCCVRVSLAEKVVFRDELNGCEMWRISKQAMFHEYCHAAKPFSYEATTHGVDRRRELVSRSCIAMSSRLNCTPFKRVLS